MSHDEAILELMVRAPACPDWFVPDMNGLGKAWIPAFEGAENYEANPMLKRSPEFFRQQLAQWPNAYARMVLDVAKEKPHNQFTDKDLRP